MADVFERLKTALADRYSIEREIGSGGMATVYLAEDLKHHRPVAVKVLRPELAAVLGADRFVQEITTTANLQHPHILPLFDSGEANGFLYYVMPFIDGETLRDKLNREKQLGVEHSVEITKTVASALDYAHRHNVIHRDIKPENILLHDGQPVVADFGIALAVRAAGGTRLTETGLSLGTPQYMSPEQATADREIDGRSDIYSLACVLYEMLCGEPPFTGPTVQAVIAKVVTDSPRVVSELRDTVPGHVAASVHKALAKLPADRFDNPQQFAEAVSGARQVDLATAGVSGVGESGAGDSTRQQRTQASGRALPWLIAALMAVVAIVSLVMDRQPEGVSAEPIRIKVPVPPEYRVNASRYDVAAALSPDGRSVVYTARKQDTLRLVQYNLGSYEPTPLVGTEDGRSPFFSPDGDWVGFVVNNQVRRLRLTDGFTRDVGEWQQGDEIGYAVWLANDSIVFSAGFRLWIIPAAGGTASELTRPDSTIGELAHVGYLLAFPQDRVMFNVRTEAGFNPALLSLEDRTWDSLSVRPWAYTNSGYLVFNDGIDLRIGPYDPATLEPKGTSVPVPDDVGFVLLSPGGIALYQGFPNLEEQQVVWFARDGSVTPLLQQMGNYLWARLSPDGTQLATNVDEDDIWIFDIPSGRRTRLRDEGNNGEPVWTSDGSRVAYSAGPSYDFADTYWQAADGTGEPELLISLDTLNSWPTSFSPDDRYFAFYTSPRGTDNEGEWGIWVLDLQDQTSRPIIDVPGHQSNAMFSPDGRWLAYQSDESGDWEIYVQPFPELNERHSVSIEGGTNPIWSKDGRELFYLNRQTVFSVEIAPGAAFLPGQPRALFSGDFIVGPMGDQCYDVAPDGRFVMRVYDPDAPSELRLVVNWMTEIERLLEEER